MKIRNRLHAGAAAVAGVAFIIHMALGGADIARRALSPQPGAGATAEIAFNLWNSAGSLLLLLGAAFVISAWLGRAWFLAGAATLTAVLAAVLPALFVGFHAQPALAVLQILAFGAMALLGMLGLWRSHPGSILKP